MNVKTLKTTYETFEKQYSLPSFDDLCRYFEIERIDFDPVFILRSIRQVMSHKIADHLKLVEMLVNPTNAPSSFLSFTKKISTEERGILQHLYEKFILLELEGLELDIEYQEADEAALIASIYKLWDEKRRDMVGLIEMMRRNFADVPNKKERSYFG